MKIFIKAFQFICCAIYFIFNGAGWEYKVFLPKKIYLVAKLILNFSRVKSLSDPLQQLLLLEEILRIPKTLNGDVVECGCYNGASTAILSIGCSYTKRKLFVCDSFEGLPDPLENERYDFNVNDKNSYYYWEKGEFTSEGGLEGVKTVIRKLGNIDSCIFVKGYFKDSLKNMDTESVVLIFEDADIASSVEDCLLFLWPKLRNDCKFFSHEPWSKNVVSLFYDSQWWKLKFSSDAPGFYGSGNGILKAGYYTNVGYAIKIDTDEIIKSGKRILHHGSKGFE